MLKLCFMIPQPQIWLQGFLTLTKGGPRNNKPVDVTLTSSSDRILFEAKGT